MLEIECFGRLVTMSEINKLNARLGNADRCVMCGLCLPHCPTFNIKRNEADSPRGRLLLMRALAERQLEADQTMQAHFESCLHCLQCERVCPAQVPYGRLIDTAKQLLRTQHHARALPWWLRGLVTYDRFRRWATSLVACYQQSGLQAWLRRVSLFRRLRLARWDAMLPSPSALLQPTTDQTIPQAPDKEVVLLSGCIASVCDSNTLEASRGLLVAAGFGVRVHSGCCGALHQHSGSPEQAQTVLNKTAQAFGAKQPIVTCASGCAVQLQQYAGDSAARHWDIHAFLLKHAHQLRFKALAETVALHTPCTMRNILKQEALPRRLLERIPHLSVVPLATQQACCGAAGLHILHQQAQGQALADDTIAAMREIGRETGAKRLLTSNIGCAMHLRRAAFEHKLEIEVSHPALLLYQQLFVRR